MIWTPESDPAYGAESHKYERPIPSRAWLLGWLHARGLPATTDEIVAATGLAGDDAAMEGVSRRLQAMERDGQLFCNRRGAWGLPRAMDLLAGRVSGHRDGFGFLIPDEGGGDLFLPARQMRALIDGDRVLARVVGVDARGRREGEVVSVLVRGLRTLVGRVSRESGVPFFRPDNSRVAQEFLVDDAPHPQALPEGGFVLAEIVEWPSGRRHGRVRICEVIGEAYGAGMETGIAIRSHGIPHRFPEVVEREASAFSPAPEAGDYHYRLDLRSLPLVTIDGEDARDFDDAVYCERRRAGGWKLLVAIADVSHYVLPGSPLDVEARERGNSVYFPDRVVPMLPEALSNGLCSLNPQVDRFCLVCEMTLSAEGEITRYRFHEAVMRSQARLTYTQVAELIEHPRGAGADAVRGEFGGLEAGLRELHALYLALRGAREARGAIDFDTVETKIRFNAQGKIEKIVPVVRNDAHRMIEECMLAANVCAAKLLIRTRTPSLYRNHEGPTPEKLEMLTDYLRGLGLSLHGTSRKKSRKDAPAVEPADYQRVMARIKDRPDAPVIQTVMLRSMSQAVYQAGNRGHFGLGYEAYTHFTSPIRRYPDLLVHRALRVLIREGSTAAAVRRDGAPTIDRAQWLASPGGGLEAVGEHCSMTERRADEATRDVIQRLKCDYMRQHIGEEFDGVVSAVTGFGLFVNLVDIHIEGLVHISTLENDYWHFDAVRHCLSGERSGRRIGLGVRIRVRVAAVNVDDRKIDLVPAGHPRAGAGDTGRDGLAGETRSAGRSVRAAERSATGARERLARDAARKPKGPPGRSRRKR